MTQEESRQKYYEYRPDSGAWWVKTPPARELWFEADLARIGGYHPNGKVNLRVVWGGTAMSDIAHRPQLKYQRMCDIIRGYKYERKDGSIGYIAKGQQMSDEEKALCKNREELVPVRVSHAFGRLRWVVEKYCPPEQLRAQQRFTHLHSPDGEKILRDFPNDGIYEAFFVVMRKNRSYRDLDNEVLTAVEAMYHFNLREQEAQAGLDAIEESNNQTLVGASEARQIYNDL